jgi:hypothetical protein
MSVENGLNCREIVILVIHYRDAGPYVPLVIRLGARSPL